MEFPYHAICNVMNFTYTPVQSGTVNLIVSCSPSFNFANGIDTDAVHLRLVCPNPNDTDYYHHRDNYGNTQGYRNIGDWYGNIIPNGPVNHAFINHTTQTSTGTYTLEYINFADDQVYFMNFTTITIMELAQTV